MLRRLAKYRRLIALVLLMTFSSQALLAEADWYYSQVNTNEKTAFWLPSTDTFVREPENNHNVCVSHNNLPALAAANDLDCVQRTVQEVSKGHPLDPASAVQLMKAYGNRSFLQGVAEGFWGELKDLWKLPSELKELPDSIRAVIDNPSLLRLALEKALLDSATTIATYICEPTDEHAEKMGDLVGRTLFSIVPYGAVAGAVGKVGKIDKIIKGVLDQSAKDLKKIPDGAHHIAIRGNTLDAFQEAFNLHKKANVVSYLSYTTRDGKSHLLRVVPKDLHGVKNRQLVIERADGGPVPFEVVQDVFKDITKKETLPDFRDPKNPEGLSTGIGGEKPKEIVIKEGDRSVVLRSGAGSTGDSGPVWTIKINKPKLENGFEEIKFKR
jgi:hypothetical protein